MSSWKFWSCCIAWKWMLRHGQECAWDTRRSNRNKQQISYLSQATSLFARMFDGGKNKSSAREGKKPHDILYIYRSPISLYSVEAVLRLKSNRNQTEDKQSIFQSSVEISFCGHGEWLRNWMSSIVSIVVRGSRRDSTWHFPNKPTHILSSHWILVRILAVSVRFDGRNTCALFLPDISFIGLPILIHETSHTQYIYSKLAVTRCALLRLVQ